MFWMPMFMMSPMMFDAPGSDNDKNHVAMIMLTLSYPVGLFLLLWLFGGNYFGYSGLKLAGISSIVILISFSMFGYFDRLLNLHKGIANSGYSVVENTVYFDAKPLKDAEANSFKLLDKSEKSLSRSYYAADASNLYFYGNVVEGALTEQLNEITINGSEYWFNAKQVIYNGVILPNANPKNFSGFDGVDGWTFSITKDKYQVYSYGKPLPPVDRDTFKPLNHQIAKDKNNIFERDTLILNMADAATFELLEDQDFGKDKSYLYYISTKEPFVVEGIDLKSLKIFERGYIKDKNNVFHIEQYKSIDKIEQADAATFEETEYDDVTKSEARDANYYYYDGKVVGKR